MILMLTPVVPHFANRQIARGGFSVVHRARDKETGDTVAVKILLLEAMEVAERLQQAFQKWEGEIAIMLKHENIVVTFETPMSPNDVLALCHRLEDRAARTRDVRWGPRTLDVDVILYGEEVSEDPKLLLPHPRGVERAFVMVPWAQIDPECRLPDGRRVADIRAVLDDSGVRSAGSLLRTVEP